MHKKLSDQEIASPDCPICASSSRQLLFSVSDHEYQTTAQNFPLVKCTCCNCVYLSPRPNIKALPIIYPTEYNNFHTTKQAESYVRKISNRLQTKRIYKLLRTFELHDSFRVLDVGCGDGYCLDRIREAFPMAITHGVEPDRRAAEYASKSHNVICSLIEDFNSSEKFDLIVSSHVVEHVENPIKFLKKLSSLMSPDGIMIIDTPNIECLQFRLFKSNWGGIHAPRHWTLFSDKTFTKAARQANLKIKEIQHLPINIFWIWSIHALLCSWGHRKFADRYFNTTSCVSDRSIYYLSIMIIAQFLEKATALMSLGLGQIRIVIKKENSTFLAQSE